MPSDSNGSYALPAGYLAQGGETILPSQHNPPLEDIAAGLTARLMRSGAGGMTGPLKATDGSVGAPSITFGTALTSGFYKTATGFGVSIGGTMVSGFDAGGVIINDQAVTYPKMVAPSAASRLLGSNANPALTITAAANNGSGLIRLTVASTATFATGQKKIVAGVAGTTEANGRWTITVVDGTHIDLQGSTFANVYTSGGTIGGGVDEIQVGAGLSMSGDTLSATTDPLNLIGYISGLELDAPGSSASFLVRAGLANDRNAGGLMRLAATINKTTSAWAVGDNNGGLDTGTIANSTWYHVHLIKRPDTGVVDVLFSLSATAPTLPTNYTLSRNIGSVITTASGQWNRMHQDGDEFYWDTPVLDLNGSDPGANLYALSVPPGISVIAHLSLNWQSTSTGSRILIHSPLTFNQTVNSPTANITATTLVASAETIYQIDVRTNTSRQIRTNTVATGSVTCQIVTKGWRWGRGK